MNSLEDDIASKMSIQMQIEIDREILWGMLSEMGWHRVMLSPFTENTQAVDILNWLEEHCKEPYECSGRDFIFESQKDATWFTLRWLT